MRALTSIGLSLRHVGGDLSQRCSEFGGSASFEQFVTEGDSVFVNRARAYRFRSLATRSVAALVVLQLKTSTSSAASAC